MLKKIFFLLLLFCISLTVFAQSPQIKWSEKNEVFNGEKYKPLGFAGDYHYLVCYPSDRRSVLMKYDRHNKLIEEREFKEKRNGISLQLIDLIKTTHENYLFFRGWDMKMKEWHLYAASLKDYKQGELVEFFSYKSRYKPIYSDVANNDVYRMNRKDVYSSDILVHTPNGLTVDFFANEHNPEDRYGLTVSDSKQYVALVEAVHNKYRKEKELICSVFDPQLKMIWNKKVRLGTTSDKMHIKQTVVGEDGSVYLLAKNRKELHAPHPDLYIVYRISKNGDLERYEVNLDGGAITVGAVLQVPQIGETEFVVTGLYTNHKRIRYRDGSFFVSGNTATGINNIKKNPFDKNTIEALMPKFWQKKGHGLHKRYKLKSGFRFSENSLGFIAELSGSMGTENLIIPVYDLKGNLIKHQGIRKENQVFLGYGESSYLAQKVDDHLYLFFNDDKTPEEKNKMVGKHRAPYTDMLVMDAQGNIESRDYIFNRKQTPLSFSSIFIDYDQGYFLFMGLSEPQFIFGLMPIQ